MTDQISAAMPASTVILVRPAEDNFEVYLLKRSSSSGFMAGKYVFPGGIVDESDRDMQHWLEYVDVDLPAIEACLGGDLTVQEALAYAIAAVRETFEEAGALLALGERTGLNSLACAPRHRQSGDFDPGWFRSLVRKMHWQLELTRLHRWAHWITPLKMKRRYDTRFFVAAMPIEQTCSPDAVETTRGIWRQPLTALKENLSGSHPLSPPTLTTLHQLSKFRDRKGLETEIAGRFWGPPVCPRVVNLEQGTLILQPWDPEYYQKDITADQANLANRLLPAGEDFSRLWLDEELWRPIAV